MRVLRVVASENPADEAGDGAEPAVVVADEDGERFLLTVDDALRNACAPASAGGSVAGNPSESAAEPAAASTAGAEADTGSADDVDSGDAATVERIHLSPREIQTRIRSGESPQALANETGMNLQRVMRFGFAVMQERSRVGDEARRSRARRDGDGALVPFGETVDRRFTVHGIDPAGVDWDAYRRTDGSWAISAHWSTAAGRRQAEWSFSLTARTVVPADEAAADLLSDRPLRAAVRAVPDDAGTDARPAADAVFDQENSAGYSASASSAGEGDGYGTTPLPLRLADPPDAQMSFADDAADPTATADDDRASTPLRLLNPRSDRRPAPAAGESLADTLLGSSSDASDEPGSADTDASPDVVADAEPAATPSAKPAPSGRRRSGREHVPSWDDILLGVRRKQD